MPIRILDSPEPLSEAARNGQRSILIPSDASRLLAHEALRYQAGAVSGRSFLVSGHRGSGKTTLVLDVFQQLLDAQSGEGAARRPLLVMLHGPNLLPDLADGAPTPPKEGDEAKEGAAASPQTALVQITLGLYRSLAREFSRAFRGQLLYRLGKIERKTLRALRRLELDPQIQLQLRTDLAEQDRDPGKLELAAQLELELDQAPQPARLREYWRQAGFLPRGVLFAAGQDRPPDQGFRELLALSSACEVYRRISGTFTDEETRKKGVEAAEEAGLAFDSKGQDLMSPFLALLTGGLVGTGTVAAGAGGIGATFTGLVAALGAASVFKYSAGRKRSMSVSQELTFARDLTLATLDRELPLLIERIRDAGLTPIFVVDELDKVEGLSDRITTLVRRLKKLVAERAFFCFLTDRRYYEEMRQRTSTNPYPIEYTYFTHQVFVVFRPDDFHHYLGRVLEAPPATARSGTGAGTAEDEETAAPEPTRDEGRIAEARADYPLLPYILLHQCQMHPIDLRRRLALLRQEDGTVGLPAGAVRTTRGNRFDLLIQIALEMVLDHPEMREVLDREPQFRRLAHDALYYPTRCWREGHEELDLGDEREEAFGEYLIERMETGPAPEPAVAPAVEQKPGEKEEEEAEQKAEQVGKEPEGDPPKAAVEAPPSPRPTIRPGDRRFLFERVRELAQLLSDPEAYRSSLEAWESRELAPSVRDALPLGPPLAPLLERQGDDGYLYRWRFDRTGRPLVELVEELDQAGGGLESLGAMPGPSWEEDAKLIQGVSALLGGLSGGGGG